MSSPTLVSDSIRAHALRFERPLAPAYPGDAGVRVLVAFAAVALLGLIALRWLFDRFGVGGDPCANLALVFLLLAAFVVAHRVFVRLPFAEIGLRPWDVWTRRERLYLGQVGVLASIAFAIVFRAHLQALVAKYGVAGFVVFPLLTGLVWGAVQELLHRGWLQTELTRRYGAVVGLLAANAVFTFGPLHWDYFAGPDGVRWSGLAAIFAIGLLFGLIYQRSGNLWIPAVLHGIWPPNMT